ncbi:transposase [Escherichia coli]|nr:transposase [Escherichia coli]
MCKLIFTPRPSRCAYKNVTPGRRKGCPNYPPEFKQQLVAASCDPGISISKLALENGINANLLFK